jgi:hypothetical protein
MGSANCSAAAWLAKHDAGNGELVVPYNQAELEDFQPLLALFTPKTASLTRPADMNVPIRLSAEIGTL